MRDTPVIPLAPDYDANNISKLHHSTNSGNGAEKTTVAIPVLSEDATPCELLTFIGIFQRRAKTIGWTTGPKLISMFQEHLEEYHVQSWEESTQSSTNTVQGFKDSLVKFKKFFLSNEDYCRQLRYV